MQNEFSSGKNIALTRQFVLGQFMGWGMIADFAIYQPDKRDGGISNPHFPVMCSIRLLDSDGNWGAKQRWVYRLDEGGNRILGEDGKALFNAVPTID